MPWFLKMPAWIPTCGTRNTDVWVAQASVTLRSWPSAAPDAEALAEPAGLALAPAELAGLALAPLAAAEAGAALDTALGGALVWLPQAVVASASTTPRHHAGVTRSRMLMAPHDTGRGHRRLCRS